MLDQGRVLEIRLIGNWINCKLDKLGSQSVGIPSGVELLSTHERAFGLM
jgi:hypothetical protein